MLIFSRKLGQAVHVGDGIVIRIVEVRRSRIRIGIEAPQTVRIQRDENISRPPEGDDEAALLAGAVAAGS
jgi:carbon storage regulator